MITFDPAIQNQRGSLLLANNTTYITWASHCDTGPYHGWLIGYDRKTLAQVIAKSVTPNGKAGGIWQSNSGPSADKSGAVYLSVGDGTATAQSGGTDYGNAFLKFDRSGVVVDWFIPHDTEALSIADSDIGTTGLLLIPKTHLLAGGGKNGKFYLLDRSNLGHFRAHSDSQIVQSFMAAADGLWGTPALGMARGTLTSTYGVAWTAARHIACAMVGWCRPLKRRTFPGTAGWNSRGLSQRSQGGYRYSVGRVGARRCRSERGPGILRAYDATDLSHELWNSKQNAARDDLGALAKFNTPLVANGKVYMATFSDGVVAYGLLSRPRSREAATASNGSQSTSRGSTPY